MWKSLLPPLQMSGTSPRLLTPDKGVRRQWEQKLENIWSMELQKPRTADLCLSKHGAPLTPGFPLLYEQPGSCNWLGTVAGVALEIKIAPLVAELGCHPRR